MLSARVARLERSLPGAGGRCACPGSIDVVHATDNTGAPLPVRPRKVCNRCGGSVTRIEVRYAQRPLSPAPVVGAAP